MDDRATQSGNGVRPLGTATRLRPWLWERLFPAPAIEATALLEHQRRALRSQVPILLAVMFVAAGLVGLVFWNVLDHGVIAAWVGAQWAYCGFGVLRWWRRRRHGSSRPATRRFVRRSILTNLSPGLLWSVAAFLFFVPERYDLQVFLVFMVAGMSAGMVAAASAVPAAALAFVLPTMAPITFQMFRVGTQPTTAIALMGLVYIVALLMMLRNGHRSFCDGVAAEQRAYKAERELRESIEALDDGFALYDGDLRIVMHNARYLGMLADQASGASLIGVRFEDQVRNALKSGYFRVAGQMDGDIEQWVQARVAAMRAETGSRTEMKVADGRTFLISTRPMTGERRVAIISDITALKQAENRLYAAIEAMDDGFVLYGADGRVVMHNRRFVQRYPHLAALMPLVGRTQREIIEAHAAAKCFLDGPAPGDETRWVDATLNHLRQVKDVEFECEHVDGPIYLIRTHITADGALLGITTDITAVKRAEQRLRSAIEAMDDGFVLFGPDDRLLLHNRKYIEHYPHLREMEPIVGRTREEVLLHFARSGEVRDLDPRDAEAWVAGQLASLHHQQAQEFERAISDGRTLLVRLRPTREDGFVAITTDVTALRRAQKRLVDALESMSDSFVLWDEDDRLVLYNTAYAKMFEGVPRAIEVGARFEDILRAGVDAGVFPEAAGREDAFFKERLARHRNPGDPAYQRFMNNRWLRYAERRTSDGGIVGLRSDVTETMMREQALRDSQRELAKRVLELEAMQQQLEAQRDEMRGIMRQLLQARDEAAAANAAKSVFLANMSHELRTPLNAIIGFSEIMSGELFGPLGHPRYEGYVGDMLSAARHLLRLINDILDLSKIEAGKWELREEQVDLRRLLDGVMRMFRGRDEAQRLELRVEARGTLPPFKADERALKQILINLMSNAIKFTPPNGRIYLRARRDAQGRLVLSIGDTGIGIRQEDVAKALAPFGQLDSHMTRRHQGTGLGLSIARALAEQHGGRVRLRSRPGRGTVISVILPAERFAAAESGANRAAA